MTWSDGKAGPCIKCYRYSLIKKAANYGAVLEMWPPTFFFFFFFFFAALFALLLFHVRRRHNVTCNWFWINNQCLPSNSNPLKPVIAIVLSFLLVFFWGNLDLISSVGAIMYNKDFLPDLLYGTLIWHQLIAHTMSFCHSYHFEQLSFIYWLLQWNLHNVILSLLPPITLFGAWGVLLLTN